MANPYLPPEIPPGADLPEATHPVPTIERQRRSWLPIAIVIALVLGIGYYYYYHGYTTTMGPHMQAADAETKSVPTPH